MESILLNLKKVHKQKIFQRSRNRSNVTKPAFKNIYYNPFYNTVMQNTRFINKHIQIYTHPNKKHKFLEDQNLN